MNRIDRLHAMAAELRATSPRPRTSRQLAEHFHVSRRTIGRDLTALRRSGVPVGRTPGGYHLDKSGTLAPLSFTPGEAMAIASALGAVGPSPALGDTRSALRKIVAVLPPRAVARTRRLATLSPPLYSPGQRRAAVAEVVQRAVRDMHVLRIEYRDARGTRSMREVEPIMLVASPYGWYLTGRCRLRREARSFRLDRILRARLCAERVDAH